MKNEYRASKTDQKFVKLWPTGWLERSCWNLNAAKSKVVNLVDWLCGGLSLSKIQSDILEQHSLDPNLAVSCSELLAFICFTLHNRLIRHYLATPRRIIYAPSTMAHC